MKIRSIVIAVVFLTGCDAHITFNQGEVGSATVATVSIETKRVAEVKATDSIESTSATTKPTEVPRPAWVNASPGLHNGVYETSIVIGPEPTREACDKKLEPSVESAALRYVANEYGAASDQSLDVRFASLPTRVVGPSWEEHVTVDGEDSIFLHTQLRFDDQLRTEWRHTVERWTTKLRTFEVVRGFALAMGALLVVHLGLRFAPRRGSAT